MKKLTKRIFNSLLAMAMILTCFTACGKKEDTTGYAFDEKNPLEYYQSVEAKSIDYTSKKIDETLSKISSISAAAEMATKTSATVKIDPEFFVTMLGTSLPFDLNTVSVNGTMNYKKDKGFNILGDLSLNDQSVMNFNSVFDQSKNNMFFKLPELSQNYLYLNFTDLQEQMGSVSDKMSNFDMDEYPFDFSKIDYDAFNDIELSDVIDLYSKYAKVLVNATEEAKIEDNAVLDVNGQEVECKKLVSTLTADQLKKAIDEILTDMKDNDTVNKFLKGYGISNDEFNSVLDNAIKEIMEEESDDSKLIIEVYINDDNEIIGRKFFGEDDESSYFKYGVVEGDNGKSVTEVSFVDDEEEDNFKIIIDSTTTDELSSGTATLSAEGTDYVINFKNVSFSEDKVTGEFSFDITEMIEMPSVLTMKFDVTNEKQNLTCVFEMNDKEYITVEFNSENAEYADFDIPEIDEAKDYNISDENAMATFGEEAKINMVTVLDKIAAALGTDLNTLMQIMES